MKTLDIQKITRVVNGKVSRGDAKVVVTGFSTDSRTLRPGDLFIPLRGEHFDGHDFLLWQRNPSVGNLADWQTHYGDGAMAAIVAVPEPAALVLLLGLGGGCLRGRRP